MLRQLSSHILLIIMGMNSYMNIAVAFETAGVNTLDDLPFGEIEAQTERTMMLDGDISPLSENPREIATMSGTIELDIPVMNLLAEKIAYEQKQPLALTPPPLSLQPIIASLFSGSGILSTFLESADNGFGFGDKKLSPESGKKITIKNRGFEKKYPKSTKGAVSYDINPDTIITSADGSIINTSDIGITLLDTSHTMKAKALYEKKMKTRGNLRKGKIEAQVSGFEFGIPGTHLLFSKPVALTIETPNMGEGMVIDLMTLHAGDVDFNTKGLSLSPDTLCNSDGSVSLPGTEAIVKNGKIIFYTCGASSFTMNPTGGTAGSNDLRVIIGDCAQIQLYYNNLTQIYTGGPPATGCTGVPSVWPTLRIGATTYGNTFTAWTSATTTGSTIGNVYAATSTMRATVGGLNYGLIIDWTHTAPNKYLTWSWRVVVPAGNTQNVRFYYGMDSFVAGADTADVGYFTNTGGQTVGIYDNVANIVSAFRYMSGTLWTAYQANGYNRVRTQIANGTDFNNTIQNTAGDLGFGVNWNFGTGANATYSGTVEWRLLPYVAANVPDLIPGIGAPEGPLTSNLLSQYPITLTNAGNLTSSGVHTVVLTIPMNVIGPPAAFSDNGWSCGAQVGTGVTCTKTTTIAPITGNETVRIPVTPNTTASGTNVRFDVRITNPGDSNTTNNTAFAINPVVGGVATSPGGVAGATLWLQANSGTNCTITGCTITAWSNSGTLGVAANAVTGLGTVTYDPTNRMNGNPTLYFNAASLNIASNLNINTAAASIFTVTKIGTGGQFLIGTQTATNNALEWATTPTQDRFKLYNNATAFYSGANLRSANIPGISGTIRQTAGGAINYTNGRQTLTSTTPITNFTASNIGIGRLVTTNSTLSNIAEVVVYPSAVTLAQKNQVESYLAVKYGITLDQTTATNYTYSNGTIAWNAATAGIYNKNIAGIARDDSTGLSQLRSQSINNTGDILIARASLGTNRSGLFWSNDFGQISTWTGVDASLGFQRISLEWFIQELTSDIGNIVISYPSVSLPSGFSGTLIMLVDSDGVFATGATTYTGVLNGATWDFNLNLNHGEYVTFAQSVPIDTTAPVITSVNVASGTLIPSGTFSYTIGYTDTGSAINTGSVAVGIFSWNTGTLSWNTTNLGSTYISNSVAGINTGTIDVNNLPFGRYRFDITVGDTAGNILVQSYTYFVDAIEWTISAPIYDIGNAMVGIDTFGTGELIVTLRTVGAGFNLSMIRNNNLTYLTDVIDVYNGTNGWGYSQWNGAIFPATITSHGTTQTLANIAKNINQNGQKNTFTYRVKYAVNASSTAPAGDYSGTMNFGLNMTY